MEWARSVRNLTAIERVVLTELAYRANDDGTDAFPSRAKLAEQAGCHVKSVQKVLGTFRDRGLIAPGNQRAAEYIRDGSRPVVYDLLIPAVWYSADQLAVVNKGRAEMGRGPVTADNRPPQGESHAPATGGNREPETPATVGNRERQVPATAGNPESETPGRGSVRLPEHVLKREPVLKEKDTPRQRGDACEADGLFTVEAPDPPHASRSNGIGEPAGFADWYGLYPRKKSRIDAAKAYRQASRKHGDALLLAELRRWLDLWRDARSDPDYLPYPATWLRNERWTDEPPEPRRQHLASVPDHGGGTDDRVMGWLDLGRTTTGHDQHHQEAHR